jgi:hypothetical protein
MSLAIEFWRLMHYISPMDYNYCGRADSLAMKASRQRLDLIHENGCCGGIHGRRLQSV